MAREIWQFKDGTEEGDYLKAASGAPDDSVYMAGYTYGNWSGVNAGSSDWAALKLNSTGDVLWRWQDGSADEDEIQGAVTTQDGSVVLAGSTGHSHDRDFAAVKLSADGTLLWKWQNGSDQADYLQAIVATQEGSLILAGYTWGDWSDSISRSATGYHVIDFAACKLDADGKLLWKWQGGTSSYDYLNAAAVGEDGSVVLAGSTRGNWAGPSGGGGDFAAVKLDVDGNEVWRWQDGTSSPESLHAAAMGEDGSVVLAGASRGDWDSAAQGSDTSEFAAVKLDVDGREVWRWQGGSDEVDIIRAAVLEDDGAVFLAGYTFGAWGGSVGSAADFAAVRLDINGTELGRWQGAFAGSDFMESVAVGRNGEMIFAGYTTGVSARPTLGAVDFFALKLDVEALDDPPLSLTSYNRWPSFETVETVSVAMAVALVAMAHIQLVYRNGLRRSLFCW